MTKLYHITQAMLIAAIAAAMLFFTATMLSGCQQTASLNASADQYRLSNEQAGYDQAAYDECMDAADSNDAVCTE